MYLKGRIFIHDPSFLVSLSQNRFSFKGIPLKYVTKFTNYQLIRYDYQKEIIDINKFSNKAESYFLYFLLYVLNTSLVCLMYR